MSRELFTLMKYDLQTAFEYAKDRGEVLYGNNFTIVLESINIHTNSISGDLNYTFVFLIKG